MESCPTVQSEIITGQLRQSSVKTALGMKAVTVSNAYKNYGSRNKLTRVFQNFNLTLDSNTIYTLVGASGCGKTTLLSCLVGLLKLDEGVISVLGTSPGTKNSAVPGKRVGFMPQETALHDLFTIKETLEFYGAIYGLSQDTFQKNYTFLMDLLNISSPMSQRRIETLSGGEKRRVSFAVALIHNPELVILDEPTVGVDPIIRESIWKHLRNLVDCHKVTVLITTHYHDEAVYSDKMGFMRNGRLLLEISPSQMLKENPNYSLQENIMNSCTQDENQVTGRIKFQNDKPSLNDSYSNNFDADGVTVIGYKNRRESLNRTKLNNGTNISICNSPKEGSVTTSDCHDKLSDSFNRIKALTKKNSKVMMSSMGYLLLILMIPSLNTIGICTAVGNDPKNLKVGVINYEVNDENFTCVYNSSCTLVNLSCQYLSTFPKEFIELVYLNNEGEAIRQVHKGNIWGYMVFPHNFSSSLAERGFLGNAATTESVHGSTIIFRMDMTNSQIGNYIRKIAFETYHDFTKSLLLDCELDPHIGDLPLKFDTPVYGDFNTNVREFFAPSIVIGLLFFSPLCSSGIQYITEKKLGIIKRAHVAGVTTWEIMLSHFLTQGLILVIQTSSALLLLKFIFKVGVVTNFTLAVSLGVLVGTCGVSMALCTEEIKAVLLAIGGFFPNFLFSGMVWPIQGMAIYLQYISYILPCTLPSISVRAIISKGFGLTHPLVWPGFVCIFVWIIIFTVAAFLVETRYKRK